MGLLSPPTMGATFVQGWDEPRRLVQELSVVLIYNPQMGSASLASSLVRGIPSKFGLKPGVAFTVQLTSEFLASTGGGGSVC